MKFLRRILLVVTVVYALTTLPVMFVFLRSEYVRYVSLQMVTNWKGKLIGLPAAFVGDSITAGGRNWGMFLGAINLGGNGYLIWQIEGQLGVAEQYSPATIYILAGTNDIIGKKPFKAEQFEQDYASLLNRALLTKSEIVVTLIPFTALADYRNEIQTANQIIRRLSADREILVVDLNPTLAPDGILLPQYTVDGVHFSPAAYEIWREMLGV